MNSTKYLRTTVVGILAWLAMAPAIAQDSAVLNPQLGTWQLYFKNPDTEQWVTKSYEARTAIEPRIQTHLQWSGAQFQYRYQISNSRSAKQNISVIRVWGIPLIYPVPNLPPIVADIKIDPEAEFHQHWAQLIAKKKFYDEILKPPKGWSGDLRTDEKVSQTSFVWTPGLKDTDSIGILPGQTERGFTVLRPELPGVARTYLQGRIAEPWGLDNLPDTPFWSQKIDEIQDQDYVLVPVLAPIIVIPSPFNSAELARRIKTHVQTWVKYGHISADALIRLNRQFDVLIPALEGNNKPAIRSASFELFKELFVHHHGLDHYKLGQDDDDQFDLPLRLRHGGQNPGQQAESPPVEVQRIAARALAFDLRYLLTRVELGR